MNIVVFFASRESTLLAAAGVSAVLVEPTFYLSGFMESYFKYTGGGFSR